MTLVAYQRQCLFGKIVDKQMVLWPIGKIVHEEWFASLNIRKEIHLDPEDFTIIPNHIHCVIQILETENVGAHYVGAQGLRPIINSGGRRPPLQLQRPPRSLSSFIAGFKSAVTKRALTFDKTLTGSVWQRNVYEHIIRNEREWMRIRAYIETNPINWVKDEENPEYQRFEM